MTERDEMPIPPAPDAEPPVAATPASAPVDAPEAPETGSPGPAAPPPQAGSPTDSPFRPAPPHLQRANAAGRPNGRQRSNWAPWIAAAGIGCLPWVLLLALISSRAGSSIRSPLPGGGRVGLVRIEGAIAGGGGGGFLGGLGGSDQIVRQLERARLDSSIKAVVLRINSPGGSAAAAQEIHEEVLKLRRARKPVITSMGDVAASAGYYIAAGSDEIVANGSTLTGSIGVIMDLHNLQGLYQKIGVDTNTIKSGRYKDIGSSSRPMTPEERQLLQSLINDVYEQFLTAVIQGRKQVPPAQLRRLADGRIFTGRQALRLKLVDSLGNMQDAVQIAGKRAGLGGRPTVVEMGRQGLLDALTGETSTYGERLRLPGTRAEEERLLQLMRQLLSQQSLPR